MSSCYCIYGVALSRTRRSKSIKITNKISIIVTNKYSSHLGRKCNPIYIGVEISGKFVIDVHYE